MTSEGEADSTACVRSALGINKLSYLDWALRGQTSIWRYGLAIGLGLVFGIFFLPGLFALGCVLLFHASPSLPPVKLFSFLPGLLGILLLVKVILQRPSWSVALPWWPTSWQWLGSGLAIGTIIAVFPPPFVDFRYEGFAALRAISLGMIMLVLVGLLIQTATEEILFRGLILQAAYRFTGKVWLAIMIQALLFALLHIGNIGAWEGTWLAMMPYFVTAAAWGWVATRSGSLVLPWMLHFTNNASTTFLVGVRGDVLTAWGVFSIMPPSIPVAIAITCVQAALWIGLTELWFRRRTWHLSRGSQT